MSLKSVLSRIRKIEAINYPVRFFLKKGHNFFRKLIQHWPVSGTVNARYEEVPLKLYNRCDDGFVQYFFYDLPYQETTVLAITSEFAKRSESIIDIGANTGIDAIIVAKKNPRVTIYAVEPYLTNYERLEKNIMLNNVGNIKVHKVALGDREGVICFNVPVNGRVTDVSSAVDGLGEKVYGDEISWGKVEVKQTTLDKLYRDLGQVGFFKCDVEGYEINVFRGAELFFEELRPTFIVEICLTETSIAFFNTFAQNHGYTIYYLSEEGLIKLNTLYIIDWRGDFLFSLYDHPFTFIPTKDIEQFVEKAWAQVTS